MLKLVSAMVALCFLALCSLSLLSTPAPQEPGGGELSECYTCDASSASGTVGFPGFAQCLMVFVDPNENGKCGKLPGPTAPCNRRIAPCDWTVTGGGSIPFGYGPTGSLPGGDISFLDLGPDPQFPSMHQWSIVGSLTGPCGSAAAVVVNIVDEEGVVVGSTTFAVDCDACPG